MNSKSKILHFLPNAYLGGLIHKIQVIFKDSPNYEHVIAVLNKDLGNLTEILPGNFQVISLTDDSVKILALRRFINQHQPQLVITYNWLGVVTSGALTLSSYPHLHVEENLDELEAFKFNSVRSVTRGLLLKKTTVIVPSLTFMHSAVKFWGLAKDRVKYIPNGVSFDEFHKASDSGLPEALIEVQKNFDIRLGIVTSLRNEKSISYSINALMFLIRNHQINAHLTIVGHGPELESIKELVHSLKLQDHVYFAGHVTNTAPYYKSFHFLLVSSDTEQMPFNVLEAMAAGCLVVASNIGDLSFFLGKSNAKMLLDNNEPLTLMRGIVNFLEKDEYELKNMADENVVKAEGFSEAKMRAEWLSVIESKIKKK